MLKILSDNEIEIMTRLDKKGKLMSEKEELYKTFEEKYAAAEDHIPTRYAECNYKTAKKNMRRNYNYLWQMAEAIKIEFYKSSSTVSVDFSKEEDRNICIGSKDDYYLYVRKDKNDKLKPESAPLNNISITIKEISRIIYPDIYALLSVLLSDGYNKNALQDINFFRLSGQSCNITLFHDLMKEFVPGRKIRRKLKNKDGIANTEMLKIACLEGCIRYLIDKDFSQIIPDFKADDSKMLYNIFQVSVNDGTEKLALNGETADLIPKPITGRRICFVVKDAYNQKKNTVFYDFELNQSNRTKMELEDLHIRLSSDTYWNSDTIGERIINKLRDIELHSKGEERHCIFLLPAKSGYGFRIYQVGVSYDESNGKTIYALVTNKSNDMNDGEYHSFEKMASFFDGKR